MSADRQLSEVRFLTVAEVASIMRVSKMTVANGFISCGTVGTTTNTFRATKIFGITVRLF